MYPPHSDNLVYVGDSLQPLLSSLDVFFYNMREVPENFSSVGVQCSVYERLPVTTFFIELFISGCNSVHVIDEIMLNC